MAMYRVRPPLTMAPIGLDQGDIVAGFPRPGLPTAKNIAFMVSKNQMKYPTPPIELANRASQLRVFVPIVWLDYAIVVSNSCDNASAAAAGEAAVELAPLRPFTFRRETDEERWLEISTAATGTGSPKLFYLAGDDTYGLPRSHAVLADKFPVSFDYVMRCAREAGTRRVCGLTKEAQVHLQWQLAVAYGRNDREDLEWPSAEDLKLKRAWLRRELADPKKRDSHERYTQELAAVERAIGEAGNGHGRGIEVQEIAAKGADKIDALLAAQTPTAEVATPPEPSPPDPSEEPDQ